MSETQSPDGFSVRVDFERILETIAARIYDNQFAFLRENVQNAIDAIRIQARRDGKLSDDPSYRIDIEVAGSEARISDNGIGMTRAELVANFWTMGASGKNTLEARAAGCIGTFGIGGFANFGVCDTLEVISRTESCRTAHVTSLSTAAFGVDRFALPKVSYVDADEPKTRGTRIRGVGKEPFNVSGLGTYIRSFVRHVREAVFFNGTKISQLPFESAGQKHRLGGQVISSGVTFELYWDGDSTLSADILGFVHGKDEVRCVGYVKLVHGALTVYKRGFQLCSVNVSSQIGISGWLDCDALRPTAGRDTIDSQSLNLLTHLFQPIESAAGQHIIGDSDLLAAHIRLIPDFLRRGWLEQLGKLRVDLVGGQSLSLEEIRASKTPARRVYYTSSGRTNSATEVLSARGHVIVRVSGNSQRRQAEVQYLRSYCDGQELDGLLECIEVYEELDQFERSVLTELNLSIKKLFKPPEFRLVAGKLTLDTPIFWSSKQDRGVVVVFVDTRHGEFQKLRPLGYSALFWSMMEAFCREYLSDTLRRQSLKYFGTGAVDLDAFSKANSELWELVLGDIEVSRLGVSPSARPDGGRVVVFRRGDVARLTIGSDGAGVVASTPDPDAEPDEPGAKRSPPKILQIVDESGESGLGGYYLRIPESATAAFGELIRTFPSLAVVWYANRITWQATDLETTAFLFDITLDRLVGKRGSLADAQGAAELSALQLQSYEDQLYFHVPPSVQEHVIPQGNELIRIQLRHELVDLNRARAWTSKDKTK